MVDTHRIIILIESIFKDRAFRRAQAAIQGLQRTAARMKYRFTMHMEAIQKSVSDVRFSFKGLPTLMLTLMFFGWQLKRTFMGFLEAATAAYMKITEGQTKTSKALLAGMAAWEFFKFSVIEALGPLIQYFTELFVQIMDFITAHPLLMKFVAWGLLFAGILGTVLSLVGSFGLGIMGVAAAFGPLMSVIGLVISLLGGPLTVAIMAVIGVISLLYMAWKNNWFGIRDILSRVWEGMKFILGLIWRFYTETIPNALYGLYNWFKKAWNAIGNVVKWVWEHLIKPPLDAMINFFYKIKQTWDNTVGAIVNAAKGAAATIRGALGGFVGGIRRVVGLQEGGYIRAPTLAMLHPGETVLPAGAAPINISFAPVYNISGVGSEEELRRILEEHDRELMLEISRLKIPGV